MARTNDEVNARRAARERVAAMLAEQANRAKRIEAGVVDATLSAQRVTATRDEVSTAEVALAAAIEAHERRLSRIVAAFKGEKVDVDSIAGLLDLTPKEVRRLGKLADKPQAHPEATTPPQPSLSEEQERDNDA
jgi:hypothetical protein